MRRRSRVSRASHNCRVRSTGSAPVEARVTIPAARLVDRACVSAMRRRSPSRRSGVDPSQRPDGEPHDVRRGPGGNAFRRCSCLVLDLVPQGVTERAEQTQVALVGDEPPLLSGGVLRRLRSFDDGGDLGVDDGFVGEDARVQARSPSRSSLVSIGGAAPESGLR